MSFYFNFINPFFEILLLHSTHLHRWFAFHGDEEEGRDAADTENRSKFGLLVDIHLIEIYLASIFPGERFHYGSHHLARTTPGGIEIDDSRTGTGEYPFIRMSLVIHNLFSEIRCGKILHLGSFSFLRLPYSRLRRNSRCFPVLRTRNKKW